MLLEMLPALLMRIRATAVANDIAADGTAPPSAPEERAGPPLVRTLRRRPGVSYARSANVILPLCFAERFPGWRALRAPRA
jgi:hypothetical protein